MTEPVGTRGRWRGILRTRPSGPGLLLACLAYGAALRPSLLPRTTVLQAAACALAMVAAYAVGAIAGWAADRLNAGRVHPSRRVRGTLTGGLVLVAVLAVASPLPRMSWLADQAALLGTGAAPQWWLVPPLAVLLAALLLLLGRSLRAAAHGCARLWGRGVRRPRLAAVLGGGTVAVVVALALAGGYVALRAVFTGIDADTAGQVPPTSSLRSGGPGSLVPWQTLGREGRAYVAAGPSPAQIASVAGTSTAPEPIRVFAGLESAPDAQARASLAVAELERTDAFSRAAILVITTTGNGFIDPVASDAAELVLGGDVASAAIQYSTLPSWLSFLVDQGGSQEAGRALFDAVSARIAELPEPDRPRLLVYGESLGAFGSLAAFDGLTPDQAAAEAFGGLWVGPPNASATWQSWAALGTGPAWQPVVDDGRVLRFSVGGPTIDADGAWGPHRLLMVQHPTDPVVWWAPSLAWWPPAWLAEPRGPGVVPQTRWWPWVLFEQVLLDLPGAGSAPPGVGHDYADSVPLAWVAVAQPEGWTPAMTARLLAALGQG